MLTFVLLQLRLCVFFCFYLSSVLLVVFVAKSEKWILFGILCNIQISLQE